MLWCGGGRGSRRGGRSRHPSPRRGCSRGWREDDGLGDGEAAGFGDGSLFAAFAVLREGLAGQDDRLACRSLGSLAVGRAAIGGSVCLRRRGRSWGRSRAGRAGHGRRCEGHDRRCADHGRRCGMATAATIAASAISAATVTIAAAITVVAVGALTLGLAVGRRDGGCVARSDGASALARLRWHQIRGRSLRSRYRCRSPAAASLRF